jgi:hypothetical protein
MKRGSTDRMQQYIEQMKRSSWSGCNIPLAENQASRIAVLLRGNERYRDCGTVQHVEKYDTVQADKLF